MAEEKQTPEEIELQLSERRFILEAITASSALLQVPIVTAFVWFYLSRTNAALGALNKGILAAELAPFVGDIKFPEGVLLGAAMESSEDVLNMLEGYGLGTAKEWKKAAVETTQDSGGIIADVIIANAPAVSCEELTATTAQAQRHAAGKFDREFTTIEKLLGGEATAKRLGIVAYALNMKQLKQQKCPRPDFIAEETWLRV